MNDFWTNNSIFDQYVKACGSKFAAIMYISKICRRRMIRVENCIPEAKALSWVITGQEPEAVSQWRAGKLNKVDTALLYAEDRLLYIEDKDVQDAVLTSIRESRKVEHLIYHYNKVHDECRRGRVRVLCNMIWDEMLQIDISNMIRR